MAVALLAVMVGDDLVVQGRSVGQRELLDAESVAGHLLKVGSVFGFLTAHRRDRGLPATRIGVVDQGFDTVEVPGLFTGSLDEPRATYEGVLSGLFG